MPAVRDQYADFIVNVKLAKTDEQVSDVISPPEVEDGQELTAEQSEVQAMHGTLVRLVNSKPHTNYFLNAKRDLYKNFLRMVPEALHESICWQVQKLNADGTVQYESNFVTVAQIDEYAKTVNDDWYMRPVNKPIKAVTAKPVKPVQHNFGFMKAETKKQKA